MENEFTRIKTEKYGSIGRIVLNSPETLNIIEKETFPEINEALNTFETDKEVKVVLISAVCGVSGSKKKVFSAGVNLKKYDAKFEQAKVAPARFKGELKASRSLITKIETYKKPVVIAINGFITGGFFEVALGCDAVLVSESATMSLNEVNIGLIPGYGGISRLLRLVGKNRAYDLIANSRGISSHEALELGIATKILESKGFESQAVDYCLELAGKPVNSLFLVKRAIHGILNGENPEELETDSFLKAINSDDARELIAGFLQKKD